MERLSNRINKSDARDEWYRVFLRGREEYRQGYEVSDYPISLGKTAAREWIAGWWHEHDKKN